MDKGTVTKWVDLVWEHRPPIERINAKKVYALQRLLLDVKENPNEPRPFYYLGRQYFYVGHYKQAAKTFKQYIDKSMKTSNSDMGDGYFYWASSVYELGNKQDAIRLMFQAVATKPYHREYWLKLSKMYKEKDKDLAYACLRFVEKLPPPKWDYKWESLYGAEFDDKLALAAYYSGNYDDALQAGQRALKANPDSERLKKNMDYYVEKLK